MNKPKAPEREYIGVRLTAEHMAIVDAEIGLLVGGIPGAKLSRAAFAEAIVTAELERRKAARAAAGETPAQAPALAPVAAGKAKRAA